MLNSAQAERLFQREAVLFGTLDGVPLTRVAELFGEEAAHAVIDRKPDQKNGLYWNLLEVRDRVLMFAYFPGFLYAASLANINELCGKGKWTQTCCKILDFPGRRASK